MMRTADMIVRRVGEATGTQIDLTYLSDADNTWYCPSEGLIGGRTGTWIITESEGGFFSDGPRYLYLTDSDGNLVGKGYGFLDVYDWRYPFHDGFLSKTGTVDFYPRDAYWRLPTECEWYFVKV
ncbi:MAG TPA: hypothetical protein VH414_17565 [Lichenihabitans sp.]|jgi:hypothetical protein|nr:hypothetical protein [Lichenihabitans sp.]